MGSSNGEQRTVFVTVGTTRFDRLIESVSDPIVLALLLERGYTRVLFQVGRGKARPPESGPAGLHLEWYDFKPSLHGDISAAALVIGHAGAGTITETLEAGRPMVVVVNERLMNNHQVELAHQMQTDGHLVYCTCASLADTLDRLDTESLKRYPRAQPYLFAQFLDAAMQSGESTSATWIAAQAVALLAVSVALCILLATAIISGGGGGGGGGVGL